MPNDAFDTLPVKIGFRWRGVTLVDPKPPLVVDPITGSVTNSNPLFPEGAEYLADLIQDDVPGVVASISTGSGDFQRISDTELSISIRPEATALLSPDRLVRFDIIRTDVSPPEHLNIEITVPVEESITRVPT